MSRHACLAAALAALEGCTFDGWEYRARDAGRDVPGVTMDTPGVASDVPGVTTDTPGDASDIPGDASDIPGDASDIPGDATDIPVDAGEAAPLRPVAPLSGSVLTTRRPTLRWSVAAEVTVQVCRDRGCTLVEETLRPTGDRAVLSTELPRGVHWWRAARTAPGTGPWTPAWMFAVGGRSAPREAVTGTLLDLDGDGRSDLVTAHLGNAPRVLVYRGEAGLPAEPAEEFGTPGVVGESYDHFGYSMGAAGDVDGDGLTDLVVGASQTRRLPDGEVGAAWILYGGPSPRRHLRLDPPSGAPLNFGTSVAGAGDVDGDGYGDVLSLASGSGRSAAFLFRGSPAGATLDAWTLPSEEGAPAVAAGVGDLNGDGFADVAIGEPDSGSMLRGRVRVFLGSATGLPATGTVLPAPPAATERGNFGAVVTAAGDVNGDGFADLAVGAPYTAGAGRVYVYLGGAAGVSTSPSVTLSPTGTELLFGRDVSGVGDVDGDGLADLAVGAPGFQSRSTNTVVVFHGSAGSPLEGSPTVLRWDPPGATPIDRANQSFGVSVSSVGDHDGDGFADVAVGMPTNTSNLAQRVIVFRGGAAGVGATPAWNLANPRTARTDFGQYLAP
jgi:hypothetical protein